MAAVILDGKALAQKIEGELAVRVRAIRERSNGKPPILATILVGDDPASATYVRMKGNACSRVGMESMKVVLPEETTTEELLREIDTLNANPDVPRVVTRIDHDCSFSYPCPLDKFRLSYGSDNNISPPYYFG